METDRAVDECSRSEGQSMTGNKGNGPAGDQATIPHFFNIGGAVELSQGC